MNTERLEKMEFDLKDALKAVEILTEKLIDIAVIENKFMEQTKKLILIETKCAGILANVNEIAQRMFEDRLIFRFAWMEKLFFKKPVCWS